MVDAEHASHARAAAYAENTSTQPDGTAAAPPEDTTTESAHPRQARTVDELPEWAQTEIRRVRDEAKKHRQSAKDVADQAERVPGLESQVSELTEALSSTRDELGRVRAVLNTGRVTSSDRLFDLAARINGTTQDELDADAERVVELFGLTDTAPQRQSDPTQGNGTNSLNGDPMEAKVRRILGA